MPEPQEVVIVGADGKEHVFPPGFDPQRAASIVRGDKSIGGFFGNVADSAVNFAKSLNPVESVPAVLRLAKGAVDMAVPGIPTQDEIATSKLPGALADMAKQRYGGWENIKNTAYTDPVGMVADASTLIGGGAGLLKATGMAPRVASALATASDVSNPLRAVTYPVGKALQSAGTMATHVTVRPGTNLQKQAGSKYRIARTIKDNRLITPARAEAYIDKTTQKAKDLVAGSNLPPTPRDDVIKLDRTLDEVVKRAGTGQESLEQAGSVQRQLASDLPPFIPATDLLDYRKYWDRESNAIRRAHSREMPGGAAPIRGMAFGEAADNARDVLNNIDGLKDANRDIQSAMLARGAVETASSRPHALSRIIALGTGLGMRSAPTSAAIIAADSPLLGSIAGVASDIAGKGLDAKALYRALLASRLAQPE